MKRGGGYNSGRDDPRKRRNHHETEKASCPHPDWRGADGVPDSLRTAGCPLRLVLWGRQRQRLPGQRRESGGGVPGQKSQIVRWFRLDDGDVTTTDRSRKALEEAVGKLDAATMMDADKNELNATVQNAMNGVAKNQLPQDKYSGMCIDVIKLSPTSADAAPAIPDDTRNLYWAQYARGDGSTFGEGGRPNQNPPETGLETYESELKEYWFVKNNIGNRKDDSKVDLFAGTFTKNGETYLAVVAIWELGW